MNLTAFTVLTVLAMPAYSYFARKGKAPRRANHLLMNADAGRLPGYVCSVSYKQKAYNAPAQGLYAEWSAPAFHISVGTYEKDGLQL